MAKLTSHRVQTLPCINGWLLCWGLTSQSTIFQSYRDGASASWVINQYFRGVKCLAQGHNTAAVGLEPRTSRSGVRHSTTEPPRSPCINGTGLPFCSNSLFCALYRTQSKIRQYCITDISSRISSSSVLAFAILSFTIQKLIRGQRQDLLGHDMT